MKINAAKVTQGLSENVPDKKSFTQKTRTTEKTETKLHSFKLDEETRESLEDLAISLCGGNKTLVIRTALIALRDMTFDQQREALLKVGK